LKAYASVYNSSIIKRLFERSKSLKEDVFDWINYPNISDTSEESLLLDTWHTLIVWFFKRASASLWPP
jgi:hypothetical protein